jgi:hypothetical protein
MEIYRTEPSHSVRLPWNEIHKSLRGEEHERGRESIREREKERERKREREREKPESEIDNGKLCKVVWA